MDLFNPPINYDLTTMSEKIKLEEYENPYIQVVWEDTPENFTQERIKSVKTNNVPNITQIQSASFSIFLIFKPNV